MYKDAPATYKVRDTATIAYFSALVHTRVDIKHIEPKETKFWNKIIDWLIDWLIDR